MDSDSEQFRLHVRKWCLNGNLNDKQKIAMQHLEEEHSQQREQHLQNLSGGNKLDVSGKEK